jgi:hypothetical protein
MRREYDFTDSVRNPYAKHFRKQVTLRLGTDVIEYFKALSRETGVPYQNLINLYLRDCAHSGKRLSLTWASRRGRTNPAVRTSLDSSQAANR